MKLLLCILLFGVVGIARCYSQKDSVAIKNSFIKKQLFPAGLITAGSLLNIGNIKHQIQDELPNTSITLDDYIEYAPMAQMYVYDVMGYKHINTMFDQTKYLIISQLVSTGVVHLLKNTLKITRPRTETHLFPAQNSFPSGHTTNAFVGATVLYHEFKDAHPLLAYSGYLFAVSTGALRMTNDAHWLPDVLAGAGIGILTVNLVYHFKPLKNFQPFKSKNITLYPKVGLNNAGFICQF